MSKRFELELALRGHDEGAGSVVDGITQKLRALRREEREGGDAMIKQALRQGPGGLLDLGGSLVGGAKFGLAAFAIDQVSEQIKKAAEGVGKLREEFAKGNLTVGEMAEKVIELVPVLGKVWEAGRAIREVFTGENAELERQKELTAEITKHIDERNKIMAEGRAIVRENTEEMARLDGELRVARAKDEDKGVVGAEEKMKGRLGDIQKKYLIKSGLETEKGEPGPLVAAREELAKAVAAADTAKKELRDMQAVADKYTNKGLTVPKAYRTAGLQNNYDDQAKKLNDLTNTEKTLEQNAQDAAKARDDQTKKTEEIGFAEMEQAMKERRKAQLESLGKTDEEKAREKEQTTREMRERRQLELDEQRGLDDARSEARQKAFEAQGDDLSAELEQIKQHYEDRIELAKSAAEREALAKSQVLDEAAARRKAEQAAELAEQASQVSQRAKVEAALRGQIDSLEGGGRGGPNRGTENLTARFTGQADRLRDEHAATIAQLKAQLDQLQKMGQVLSDARNYLQTMAGNAIPGVVLRG